MVIENELSAQRVIHQGWLGFLRTLPLIPHFLSVGTVGNYHQCWVLILYFLTQPAEHPQPDKLRQALAQCYLRPSQLS